MGKLKPRHAAFVREYLIDPNATQAAIRAGYSKRTAKSAGSRLLTNVAVRAEIDAQVNKHAEKLSLSAELVLHELMLIGFSDLGTAYGKDGTLLPIHEMPESMRRCISGIDSEELWEPDGGAQLGTVRKIKTLDKVRALELLGKHLRIFADVQEHRLDRSLEDIILGRPVVAKDERTQPEARA